MSNRSLLAVFVVGLIAFTSTSNAALDEDLSRAAAPEDEEALHIEVLMEYPRSALRDNLQGTVVVSVDIDPAGNPSNCIVIETSGHQVLDDATCKGILLHKRFKPARDKSGNFVSGKYSMPFTYRILTDDETLARAATPLNLQVWSSQISQAYFSNEALKGLGGVVEIKTVIGKQGGVVECEVTESSGSAALDEAACVGMRKFAKFKPAVDGNGDPTNSEFTTAITYRPD